MIRRVLGIALAFLVAAFLFAAFAASANAQQGPSPANLGDGVKSSLVGAQVALILCLLVFSVAMIAGARTATRPGETPGRRNPRKKG